MKKLFFGGTAILLFILHSCGGYDRDADPAPVQQNSARFDKEIKPILSQYCAGCHREAFVTNEASLKASKALEYLKANFMPQRGSYEAQNIGAKRETLIDFLEVRVCE